jgi:ABC-2 type transport system permease protein
MNRSFVQLLLLHVREFFRIPEVLFWTMGFPLLLAAILGVAFMNKGSMVQPIALVGAEDVLTSQPVKAWKEKLDHPYTEKGLLPLNATKTKFIHVASTPAAEQSIKQGDFTLYVTFEDGQPSYHFDPMNPEAKQLYYYIDKKQNAIQSNGKVQALTTTGLRYIDFLIPGLIAMGIMQSCLWGIGWSLIDRRIKKMLRRLIATPMNKTIFLSSYILMRVVLSLIEIAALTVFAILVFGITIQGSLAAFFILILSGNLAFSGISVLVASRAKNTQVANGLLNAVALPMMICSGIFFSYKGFPDWLIPIVQNLPLTLLADAIRKVFIEGAGMVDVLGFSGVLLLIGVVTLALGQRIFHWT